MKTEQLTTRTVGGLILAAVLSAAFLGGCSESNSSTPGNSTGGTSGDGAVGRFAVTLNPKVDTTDAYTSIFGNAYSGPVLTSVIETTVASNAECRVVAFSQQTCTNPACTTSQTCVAANVCQDNPTLVSVGDVSVTGIGGTAPLALSAVMMNYQYAGDIAYPGFAEGDAITLTATGDFYPAFSIATQGIAPVALSTASYVIDTGTPLALQWTPSGAAVGAKVNLGLNISKHGGSAGYLSCDVADNGSYTIPADLITALINLGVAGFPQLTVTRTKSGQAEVSTGPIELVVQSLAIPNLQVKGYCSCFSSADCGSCADTTKTVCDTVKKLCNAP